VAWHHSRGRPPASAAEVGFWFLHRRAAVEREGRATLGTSTIAATISTARTTPAAPAWRRFRPARSARRGIECGSDSTCEGSIQPGPKGTGTCQKRPAEGESCSPFPVPVHQGPVVPDDCARGGSTCQKEHARRPPSAPASVAEQGKCAMGRAAPMRACPRLARRLAVRAGRRRLCAPERVRERRMPATSHSVQGAPSTPFARIGAAARHAIHSVLATSILETLDSAAWASTSPARFGRQTYEAAFVTRH